MSRNNGGRRSWADDCAGWRVGIHERSKENRLAGIWKCNWCAHIFDPPTAEELEIVRKRAMTYQRPYMVRRRR